MSRAQFFSCVLLDCFYVRVSRSFVRFLFVVCDVNVSRTVFSVFCVIVCRVSVSYVSVSRTVLLVFG